MKDLIIVGSGGFGRELFSWIKEDALYRDVRVKGFLSSVPINVGQYPDLPPYLGNIESHQIDKNAYYIIAIGESEARQRIAIDLSNRGAKFFTFVHSTCYVAQSATIAEGCIIGPQSLISNAARVERHVVINVQCAIGHDTSIGEYSVLSPKTGVMGNVTVGKGVFAGTGVSIAPKLLVGEGSKIAAGVALSRDIPAKSLVFGTPNKVIPNLSPSS